MRTDLGSQTGPQNGHHVRNLEKGWLGFETATTAGTLEKGWFGLETATIAGTLEKGWVTCLDA